MRVDRHWLRALPEVQRVRLVGEDVIDEFLKEKTPLRDGRSTCEIEFAIIFDEHRVAGWLEEQHGRGRLARLEQLQVPAPQPRRFVEVPLAESGPTAALSCLQ